MRLRSPTLLCALLAAAGLYGQEPVPAEAVERVVRVFQPNPAERPLACEVRPLAPALTYRLVYRAGYRVTMPMEQFAGEQGPLGVLVRVTPKGAAPLLLRQRETLPVASGEEGRDASKFEAQLQGGFFLGAGEYHAELVLVDRRQRVCRKQWDLELNPRKAVKTALSAGQLAAFSQLGWPRLGTRPGSLTIFLHAGLSRANPVLLESLAAILEQMPFSRVQVVAFSLDQHKELLRQNVGDSSGFRRIKQALDDFNPATVSYGVLEDPAGHRQFLWQLLAKEELRAAPADAVIFVGYTTFDDTHVFVPPACANGSRKTVYAYFDYAPPSRRRYPAPGPGGRRTRGAAGFGVPSQEDWADVPQGVPMQPEMPDAISRIIRACSGKVFHIHSPGDLASALQKTGELLRALRTSQGAGRRDISISLMIASSLAGFSSTRFTSMLLAGFLRLGTVRMSVAESPELRMAQ